MHPSTYHFRIAISRGVIGQKLICIRSCTDHLFGVQAQPNSLPKYIFTSLMHLVHVATHELQVWSHPLTIGHVHRKCPSKWPERSLKLVVWAGSSSSAISNQLCHGLLWIRLNVRGSKGKGTQHFCQGWFSEHVSCKQHDVSNCSTTI